MPSLDEVVGVIEVLNRKYASREELGDDAALLQAVDALFAKTPTTFVFPVAVRAFKLVADKSKAGGARNTLDRTDENSYRNNVLRVHPVTLRLPPKQTAGGEKLRPHYRFMRVAKHSVRAKVQHEITQISESVKGLQRTWDLEGRFLSSKRREARSEGEEDTKPHVDLIMQNMQGERDVYKVQHHVEPHRTALSCLSRLVSCLRALPRTHNFLTCRGAVRLLLPPPAPPSSLFLCPNSTPLLVANVANVAPPTPCTPRAHATLLCCYATQHRPSRGPWRTCRRRGGACTCICDRQRAAPQLPRIWLVWSATTLPSRSS